MSERPVSRRNFLSKAALAASAPFVLTSPISSLRATVPSNRITLGVIGSGKRGHTLMRHFLKHDDVQIIAVNDVEPARRSHARKYVENHYGKSRKNEFTGCAEYVDYRDLIARVDIDAVIIATPDHWHEIPAVEAAYAGKDIYCEKPLTLTIREARSIADAVRVNRRVFQTGSQQRSQYGGKFRRACEIVRNGRIGKILTVHVGVGGPSVDCDLPTQPVPEGVDWNMWLGPALYRGYNDALCPRGMHNHYPAWRNYKEYSGGNMTDWGAHHFDIAQWGLGMDDSGPVEIFPPGGRDYKTLTYRYANGVTMYHGGANGVLFTGTEGTVEVNRSHFRVYPEAAGKEPLADGETKLYESSDHIRNFLDCIRTRKQPICTAEIGARSVTVCHLGNLAYWNKRPLAWNPAKEQFVGDNEANKWLERPKRDFRAPDAIETARGGQE